MSEMSNFSTTLWGEILKILNAQIPSVLDKSTLRLCTAQYDYDKKNLTIFAINDFAKKVIQKYLTQLNSTLNDIMLSENTISIELKVLEQKQQINPKKVVKKKNIPVNPKYTFDSFIYGEENKFAYNVALSVAMTPSTYTPLVLFSEQSGLGKTHLLSAIANYLQSNSSNTKVYFSTAKNFLHEFIEGIQNKNYDKLKKRYTLNDVVILDGIEHLENKIKTQEELTSILEELIKQNKQVVVSLNTHPVNLQNFYPPLKDMLSGATIAEIKPTGFSLAKKILQEKFKNENFDIPEKILNEMLNLFDFSSVREIEGAVRSTVAYFSLSQKKLNLDNIYDLFYSIKGRQKNRKEEKLLDVICAYYNIDKIKLLGKRKSKNLTHARKVAMYILRNSMDIKLKDIAKIFSKKSHATVIHAINLVNEEIKTNPVLLIDINNIKRRISI